MHEHRGRALHDFIRAVLLAGFSIYIARLVSIDKLHYYIAPKMILYVKLSALGLYVLAGYLLYSAIKQAFAKKRQNDCDCGHEPPKSLFMNVAVYGLFALPLLLGFAMPDQIMGSSMASVKGMNLNAASAQQTKGPSSLPPPSPSPSESAALPEASPPDVAETSGPEEDPSSSADASKSPDSGGAVAAEDEESLDQLFPADEFSLNLAKLGKKLYRKDEVQVQEEGFLEMLTVLDMYRYNYIGKTVVISGFVYREDDMGDDQFVVARIAMQCCSADAMPYGFLVKWGKGADYADDTWITLTGVLGLTDYNGNEIIELNARKITIINPPDDPYVYPYFDNFDKLAGEA